MIMIVTLSQNKDEKQRREGKKHFDFRLETFPSLTLTFETSLS